MKPRRSRPFSAKNDVCIKNVPSQPLQLSKLLRAITLSLLIDIFGYFHRSQSLQFSIQFLMRRYQRLSLPLSHVLNLSYIGYNL